MRTGRKKVLFVAIVGLLLIAAEPMAEPLSGPELRVVVGVVEIGSGDPPAWHAARVGDVLKPGDSLRTGEGARAELETVAGTVRMYPSSLLRVPMAPDETRRIDLDRGSSIFDVHHRDARTPFEVHTPHAVVMVKGTQFTVSDDDDGSSVAVTRGLVSVRGRNGSERELLVHPGFGVSGGAGREFSLGLLREDRGDPWQAWSKGSLPERLTPPGRESRVTPGLESARIAAHAAASRDVASLAAAAAPGARGRNEDARDRDSEGAGRQTGAMSTPGVQPPASAAERDRPRDREREEKIGTQFGAALLGPPSQYTVEVLKSGDSDRVHIVGGGGFDATFTEQQLKDVIHGNTSLLGPQLLGLLNARGVSTTAFASQMIDLM